MNEQIVECVPNFSEGRDQKTIDAIANAIRQHEHVTLVDIDAGVSTNRTVYTIVGRPNNVIDSIISAAKVAFDLIDMRKHRGEHKRIGAMDVCPFIPIKNLNMKDCVQLAKVCGERLSATLNVPVYLYGFASKADYRRLVPDIRQGEYEGLKEKITDPQWKPDFGPDQFTPEVERWGATMCGARKVLIAYNINIIGTKEQANKIAFDIREQGRGQNEPGCFKAVQAMGWTLEERNIAQITANLVDYEVTSLVQVWEEVNKLAKQYGIPVCGSEIVGVLPLPAILQVADYYIKTENLLILEEELKVQYVISRLGLSFLNEFKPREKIIEYILEDQCKERKLVDLSLSEFVDEVRSRDVVPGGGSVSALVCSLACALVTMVGRISSGKKKFECNDNLMKQMLPQFYDAADEFLKFVDLDSQAYAGIVEANRLPESNLQESDIKQSAVRTATLKAIEVPQKLLSQAVQLMQHVEKLCPVINMNAASDLQVAIKCLKTAVDGAYFNVKINLESMNWNRLLKEKIEADAEEKRGIAADLETYLLNLLVTSEKTEV